MSSVPVILSSRVSILAAPLFFCSIFPLNAVLDDLSVAGCELSISDAVSLLCVALELLSLHDCCGSSGLPESLVVSRVDNPCSAGVSSLLRLHVGDPSDRTYPPYIGHEYCDCVTGSCSGVHAYSSSDIVGSCVGIPHVPLTWGQDRFELPSFCQLLCNHGPSRRSRRSSLAGLCSDSVGGVADASSSRHSSLSLASFSCRNSAVGLVCEHDLLRLRDDGTLCALDTCAVQ